MRRGRTGRLLVCLLVLFLVALVEARKDYYRILGVARNASEKDIKKAYKKLSKKFHPDLVAEKDKEAAQKKFVEISEAYQTLKNKEKRDIYDQGGDEAVKDFEQNKNNPGGGFNRGGGMHFTSGGPGGFDFGDIFGSFFGGGGGGGRQQKRGGGGGGFGGFGGFGGGFQGHDQHGDFGDMGFHQDSPKKKNPFKDSDVIQIEKDSLYEIDNRRRLVLAIYFKNTALQEPEFETIKKFATKYKGIINVVGVDCDKQNEICVSHRVKSVPLFKVYPEDKSKPVTDFRGQISIPSLEQQTIPKLENFVQKVGQRTIQGFKDRALKESKQVFIIYPTKQSTSPLFMSLSSLFKNRLVLLEETLDDKLTGKLSVSARPTILWIKNLYTDEVEAYTGKIERTSLSLWLQDRASRKIAVPDKQITELTAKLAQTQCDRNDNNYCLVGVYSSSAERSQLLKTLEPALAKYKDDPVNFYLVNRSNLKKDCPAGGDSTFFIYRTKRNRVEPVGPVSRPEQIFTKMDLVLSGSPLTQSMAGSWASCFQ